MKTLLLKIEKKQDAAYPVTLHEAHPPTDNAAGWTLVQLETDLIPEVWLTQSPDGGAGEAGAPVSYREFLLTHERDVGYAQKGKKLFALLGRVGARWAVERDAVPQGVRTFLEIASPKAVGAASASPDLRAIPWEMLCDTDTNYLFADTANPMSRGRNLSLNTTAPDLQWPLRILIIFGMRKTDPQYEAAREEMMRVITALKQPGKMFDWQILNLAASSPRISEDEARAALIEKLKSWKPHGIHFIGHGAEDGDYKPVLEIQLPKIDNEPETRLLWNAADIRQDLKTYCCDGSGACATRFVFLNACRSGLAGANTSLPPLAEAFLSGGAQAVLAMQGDILGQAAVRLAEPIYRGIALGTPLDIALAEARASMAGSWDRRDWRLPMLTMKVRPEVILPLPWTPQSDLAIINGYYEFKQVRSLVGRDADRELLLQSADPDDGAAPSPNVMVIHGAGKIGKTWLTRWCLERCALRGHHLHYVELKGDYKEAYDVLVEICMGDSIPPSPLSAALAHPAAARFLWKLSFWCQDKEPPEQEPDPLPPFKQVPVTRDINAAIEHRKQTIFEAFRLMLIEVGLKNPFVLVLDSPGLSPYTAALLRDGVIDYIAKGNMNGVRLILVVTDDQFQTLKLADLAQFIRCFPIGPIEERYHHDALEEFCWFHRLESKNDPQYAWVASDTGWQSIQRILQMLQANPPAPLPPAKINSFMVFAKDFGGLPNN